MRLWIKFFPDIDTASVELTPQNTLNDLKNKIFELSNLTDADSIKVVYRSLPLVQKSMPLADLNLTGEETFSVIVNSCKAGKFKLNKPKAVGPIVDPDVLLRVFGFLDHVGLTHLTIVCRKWRTLTYHNQLIWKWNFEALLNRHRGEAPEKENKEEEKKDDKKGVAPMRSPRGTVSQNYKTMFIARYVAENAWNRVRALSIRPSDDVPEQVEAVALKKPRDIKIRKKPKPLSDEDAKFLKETDVNALKKNLRRDKKAQELLKKHKTIETKQQKYDEAFAVYQAIPDALRQFSYSELMKRTMGFPQGKNAEGYEVVYKNGRFYFFREKTLVIIAAIEVISKDQFKIARIIAEEEVDEKILPKLATEADVVKHVFGLLDQCTVLNLNVKKFIHIKVANPQEDALLGDAQFNLALTIADSGDKVEPSVSAVTKTPSTPTDLSAALSSNNKTNKQFDVKATLFNNAEAQQVNEEILEKTYSLILQTAHKDDQVASCVVHAVESEVLAKLGAEDASALKQLVSSKAGVFVALAVDAFLKEAKKQDKEDVKEEEVQHQSSDNEPNQKQAAAVKKEFRKIIITTSSNEEKTLLLQGVRSVLNK